MKTFLFSLLFLSAHSLSAQEIYLKQMDHPVAGFKYYWSYSVNRVGTAHDSLHHYTIHVTLGKQDNISPHSKGNVQITGSNIIVIFKMREACAK
jgi:hypothetical protein